MKKILTSTALVGSLVLLSAGISNAQTAVTGNLAMSYKATSSDLGTAAGKTANNRTFGKESQINLTHTNKLSNGMGLVAGFSLEFDGSDAAPANVTSATNAGNSVRGVTNENTFIDIISGNTTITFGADHMQNPDNTVTNLVGVADPDDIISGVAGGTTTLYSAGKNSAYQAYQVGITQTTPIGKFSFGYAPDATTGQANSDTQGYGSTNAINNYDVDESRYEIGFVGNLGVKDLTVQAFYNKEDNAGRKSLDGTQSSDQKGKMFAARYNLGTVALAYERGETTSLTNIENKSNSYGISYAVNKEITVGANYTKTDSDRTAAKTSVGATTTLAPTTSDEKIKSVSVGYNLGPIVVGLSYGEVDGYNGTAGVDGKAVRLDTNVRF
jgi:hypothetical protein